ncbi:MAG: sugar transporter [Rhodobacteraceae bacterium]|nr:sugar transporter [Paracoccaceae bacterium]
MRRRHRAIGISFLLVVLLPALVSAAYLWLVAADQYESRFGFSVRKEQTQSAVEILGGITEFSGSSTSDTDFLNKYIRGRQMVQVVDRELDLSSIYQRQGDPVFSLASDASIEDLEAYWSRVVTVFYDSSDGLIEVRVLAFDAASAQSVAQAILAESSRMINELTAIARSDVTRYAKDELDRAVDQLKTARQTLTEFRSTTQIVDPAADIEGRMGILNSLQSALATSLVDLDLLLKNTSPSDPRIIQTRQRIAAIEQRIQDERASFSTSRTKDEIPYSKLVGEYEALHVDLEFAEKNYVAALTGYESALADAQKQSRYLATYVAPTLAETAKYPRRGILLAMIAGFLALGWAIAVLIYYSIRDRR